MTTDAAEAIALTPEEAIVRINQTLTIPGLH